MRIIYKTGDLMAAPERHLLQGCNAQGRMRSGIAKIIRARYPAAYTDYLQEYDRAGLKTGQIIWSVNDPHVIINAITQDRYGYDADKGAVYVDYVGLGVCMAEVNQAAKKSQVDAAFADMLGGPVTDVAMPLVGAGLAGGDWSMIEEIIESTATDFQPVVYLLDGRIPGRD